MNKYDYFKKSETINSDSTLEEAFHEGVSFAQNRILKWLDQEHTQTQACEACFEDTSDNWGQWLEAKIDAEDQER